MIRQRLNTILITTAVLLAILGLVTAQAQRRGQMTQNQLITIDLNELFQARGLDNQALASDEVAAVYPQDVTLSVAKFTDGQTTCYILMSTKNPAEPNGLSCVR
jgi:hypothetical protein